MSSAEPIVVSPYFAQDNKSSTKDEAAATVISDDFLHLIDELNSNLEHFKMPMKVPFGEISSVRDWLGIEGPVGKPVKEIPARPVKGFECTRSEISGKRFWGLIKSLCGTPDNFFRTSFVYNYLPQQWMKTNGCNVTPNEFKVTEMKDLFEICDRIFIKVLELYEVNQVVAIGKFCETRAHKAIKRYLPHKDIKIHYLPHPSPRTVNNNNWDQKVLEHLKNFNFLQYYSYTNSFIT